MNTVPPLTKCRAVAGFTLVEILSTIAVAAILVALLFPAANKMTNIGNKAKGITNLRQVGLAVMSFANENQGRLPGPAPLGILPYYNRQGRNSNLIFGAQLALYLGLPDAASLPLSENVVVPVLADPGFKAAKKDSTVAPNFVQNPLLSDKPGVAGKIHIFGIVKSGSVAETPSLTIPQISQLGGPSKVWMLTNTDQKLPKTLTMGSGWVSNLPATPAYQNVRLRLYVDAHVETVPLDAPLP
jgi:prepilin-type N-terminal cleavage/methylation domain-containing protein